MTEPKTQTSFSPIPRRTFLAAASLGILAGGNDKSGGVSGQDKSSVAAESLAALMNRNSSEYKVDLYLRAAVSLQALTASEAQKALLSFAWDLYKKDEFSNEYFINNNPAIIALCRMLFRQREASFGKQATEFRRAQIGGAGFFGGTSYGNWPLEPIEIVDGIPFKIVQGYSLGGWPELAHEYIEYCIGNCDWNDYRFRVATMVQKQSALGKLLASPKWKQKLSSYNKEFFSVQI